MRNIGSLCYKFLQLFDFSIIYQRLVQNIDIKESVIMSLACEMAAKINMITLSD